MTNDNLVLNFVFLKEKTATLMIIFIYLIWFDYLPEIL